MKRIALLLVLAFIFFGAHSYIAPEIQMPYKITAYAYKFEGKYSLYIKCAEDFELARFTENPVLRISLKDGKVMRLTGDIVSVEEHIQRKRVPGLDWIEKLYKTKFIEFPITKEQISSLNNNVVKMVFNTIPTPVSIDSTKLQNKLYEIFNKVEDPTVEK